MMCGLRGSCEMYKAAKLRSGHPAACADFEAGLRKRVITIYKWKATLRATTQARLPSACYGIATANLAIVVATRHAESLFPPLW